MKKFLLVSCFILITFITTACEPTSTAITVNSNITQTTSYIAVTNIFVEVDHAEVCVGDQINLTVTFLPTNATNQNFTVSLSQTTYVNFLGTNQLLLEAIAQDPSGETVETIITVVSDDNSAIDNTRGVYVHSSSGSVCP